MFLHQQTLSTDSLPRPTIIAPPPWTLTGNGYIFLYRFPKKIIQKNGFLSDYQHLSYKGLVGSMMLVDYHTTPVGPYQELLFIPGLFEMMGKNTFSISKIYVSDQNSVWNGIENWGIPKERSDFEIQSIDERTEKFAVLLNEEPFFEATIRRGNFSFPLTTKLFPLRITQQLRGDWVLTKPTAKGKAYFGKLTDVKVNSTLFPDIAPFKPFGVLVVKDFQMVFPVAEFRKTEL
jgi:hypothetical protein